MVASRRVAPLAGIVASVLVLAALAVPFFVASVSEVTLYYDSGDLNPLVAGLFALVSILIFAAGREGRSDPALAAGVTLTFGVFAVIVSVVWALSVRVDVLDSSIAASHPWGLVVVTLALPVTAAWYARSLGLL